MSQTPATRDECLHCRRPRVVCWCERLAPVQTRTRIVFLQHPREARVAIGTARMAHLALPNSELHEGVVFEGHERVGEIASQEGTALLFPGEGAQAPESVGPELRRLLVVDGTWAQARKVIKQNPALAALPRIGLTPSKPGNYRIRKEPAADCLATIEAVVDVLGALEGPRQRFEPMLDAFTWMVDQQLAHAATRTGPPRRWLPRAHHDEKARALRARLGRAVVMQAEVNAHARNSGVPGEPEMLHLVAARVSDGARFEALLRPRRPLAPNVGERLEVPESRLINGEDVASALGRWSAFLRDDDVLCGWGVFTRDRLRAEGDAPRDGMDLREVTAKRFQRSPGTPWDALRSMGLESTEGHGRAGRTVEAMVRLAKALASAPD